MFKRKIQRGIKLLDEHFGNRSWLDKVKLSTLNMKDAEYCVLGQIYGGYPFGPDRLPYQTETVGTGFDLPMYIMNEKTYKTLTKEWKEALKCIKSK